MEPKFRIGTSHDRLMQAAKHFFSTRGYDEASTAMIARAAGTSESQLVKHFGSKGGLLQAVFEQGWSAVNAYAEAGMSGNDPVLRLRKLVLLTAEGLDQDPEFKNLMLLEARHVLGDGVLVTDGFRQFAARIDELLQEIQSEGILKPDLHARALRSALVGLMEGVIREHVMAEKLERPAAYGYTELTKVLDVFLEAVCMQPEALAAD